MHEITRPAKTGSGGGGDLIQTDAEPGLEKIITGARDADGPVLTKLRLTGRVGQDDRNLSEPGRLARSANKVCDGITAAVHVLFELVVSGEINEARGNI